MRVMVYVFPPDSKFIDHIRPSPNYGERKSGKSVNILLLHYTGMTETQAAIDWLCNRDSGVSCHYLIDEDGIITQMVKEEDRAWHAGQSFWQGETDINSTSIGIEIANPGHEHGYQAFPDLQIEKLIPLCKEIIDRHNIEPRNVLAHSDIAPLRKEDPGEKFPWNVLAENGIGYWPQGEQQNERKLTPANDNLRAEIIGKTAILQFQRDLCTIGYDCPLSGKLDQVTQKIIIAFRRHYQPYKLRDALDQETIALAEKMAQK